MFGYVSFLHKAVFCKNSNGVLSLTSNCFSAKLTDQSNVRNIVSKLAKVKSVTCLHVF